MNKTIALVLVIFCSLLAHAQAEPKAKGFANFDEFILDTPSVPINYNISRRTRWNVFMSGGIRNYRFKKVFPASLKKRIKFGLWGVKTDGRLYINAMAYSGLFGYNLILESGYYSYFIGQPARTFVEQRKLGIIGPGENLKAVCCKTGYVMLNTGEIKRLSPSLLYTLLSENEALLQECKSSNLQIKDVNEMFDFLKRFNEWKTDANNG